MTREAAPSWNPGPLNVHVHFPPVREESTRRNVHGTVVTLHSSLFTLHSSAAATFLALALVSL